MKCPHVTPMLIFNAAYTTSQDSMEKLFLIEEAYIHDAQQHHTKSNHKFSQLPGSVKSQIMIGQVG